MKKIFAVLALCAFALVSLTGCTSYFKEGDIISQLTYTSGTSTGTLLSGGLVLRAIDTEWDENDEMEYYYYVNGIYVIKEITSDFYILEKIYSNISNPYTDEESKVEGFEIDYINTTTIKKSDTENTDKSGYVDYDNVEGYTVESCYVSLTISIAKDSIVSMYTYEADRVMYANSKFKFV